MRIKILMLIMTTCCIYGFAADGYAQKITLSVRNQPLEIVLREIRLQSGFNFVSDPALLKQAKPVTLQVNQADLETVLERCFAGQPFTYSISKDDKAIAIKEKGVVDKLKDAILPNRHPERSETKSNGSPNQQIITGRVIDTLGQPIAGATVTAKFTAGTDAIHGVSKKTTMTDKNGLFTLRDVPASATLTVSSVGYLSLEISASANLTTLQLKPSNSPLDEVQVIAYGTQTQRYSTGNVSTVKSEDIEKSPVANPLLALAGRLPGIQITQQSGIPGSTVKVQIQGINSIAQRSDPLIVIDGVPYYSNMPFGVLNGGPLLGGVIGAGNTLPTTSSPLNFIDPNSIASISVLKDADATSIYGSRAANGAILITTKAGSAGPTRVSFNLQQGSGKVAHFMDLLNTPQYLAMRREALLNDGLTPNPNKDYDLTLWDTTRYTDWQKVLLGGTAHYTDLNAGISGGGNNITYYFGGTYHRESNVLPGDFANQNLGVNFNFNSHSKNRKFNFQLTTQYFSNTNRIPGGYGNLVGYALCLAPDAPPFYNADGSINWALNENGAATWTNPMAALTQTYETKTDNLISNANISYLLGKGFSIESSLGYNNLRSNDFSATPLTYYLPQDIPYVQRKADYGIGNSSSWIVEPRLVYQSSILPGGKLNALLGGSIQQSNATGQTIHGEGYNSDDILENTGAATSLTSRSLSVNRYKYAAAFARIDYTLNNRYIINLNARRDGSSRFGSANRYHNFASAALAWIFTEEGFFKNNVSWLSFGKLRGSYGTTGNDQISDYTYLNLYGNSTGSRPYQGISTIGVGSLSNPYVQWELTKKLQAGLDLGFFQDRFLLNFAWQRNRSSNQLLGYALPNITGFSSVTSNFPATVQNTSLELSMTTKNINGKDFSWSTSANVTVPRNKLIAFPGLETSSYANSLVIGQPISVTKAWKFGGVDPQTGLYYFIDKNGQPTANPVYPDDYTVLINTDQKWYGGISNTFRYKGLSLDFIWQFVQQKGYNIKYTYSGIISPGYFGRTSNISNIPEAVNSRTHWQQQGDVAEFQRYSTSYADVLTPLLNAYGSDAAFSDNSYWRLKNVSLSWELPQKWLKNAHLQSASVYAHAQNLLTFTKYQGLDPENQSATLPPLRILTFGVKISL